MADRSSPLGAVLVIGGCGYLGSHIVRQLQDDGDATSITVIDIRTDRWRHSNVTYHQLDICSWKELLETFDRTRPDVVFHTASPYAFGFDLKFYKRVNVGGTQNVLRAAEATGTVKALVYSSSAGVIHDGIHDLVRADEDTPVVLRPAQSSIYIHSKAVAETAVLAANRGLAGTLTCAIRLSGMFGEDDPGATKPMVEAAASGKYRYQMGDGNNLFDRTYVGNVVQGHIRAAKALSSAHATPSSSRILNGARVDGEAFLITNDEPMSFWGFARALGAAAGYPTPKESVRSIPKWLGLLMVAMMEWTTWILSLGKQDSTAISGGLRFSMMTRTYDITKAKKRLGYKPTVDMAEGIRRAGESFRKGDKHA
ncbi:MAG: hypothetical protein Q9190_006292 [Brigantiaea leucoxantha]